MFDQLPFKTCFIPGFPGSPADCGYPKAMHLLAMREVSIDPVPILIDVQGDVNSSNTLSHNPPYVLIYMASLRSINGITGSLMGFHHSCATQTRVAVAGSTCSHVWRQTHGRAYIRDLCPHTHRSQSMMYVIQELSSGGW